ncbi:MAG: hypothetical protein KGY67_09285 [Candidatus Thermoplasmatota archaeon]|nr:hypothetical protein [Candidatus Thermoplasmatota archaeon]
MKKQRSFAVIFENFQSIYHEIKNETILAFTKSNAGHPLFIFTDEKILVRPTKKSNEKPFDINYSDIYISTIQKKPMLVYFKTKNSDYTVWDIKNKNLAEIIKAQVKIKNSETRKPLRGKLTTAK